MLLSDRQQATLRLHRRASWVGKYLQGWMTYHLYKIFKHQHKAAIMKRILVPTDYSQDAHDTLLYALEMACLTGSEIVLLHAFYQPISYTLGQDYSAVVNELERQKTLQLEAYAHKVRRSVLGDFSLDFTSVAETGTREKGALSKSGFHAVALDRMTARKAEVKIRCVCKFGFAPDEILKAADVHQVDLVVMGTRGRSGLALLFQESVSQTVLLGCPSDVLVVRTGAS